MVIFRFGSHVKKVVPSILNYAQVDDDELREHCLQACELLKKFE